MKILLVSAFPPSTHNIGGPSALPYYLALHKPENVQVDLVYYEGYENKEEFFLKDLPAVFTNIYKFKKTAKRIYYPYRLIQKLNIYKGLADCNLRYLPDNDFDKVIDYSNYDVLWLYPHTLYLWIKKFRNKNIVVTGPDCSYLHYSLMSEVYKPGSPDLQGKMLENEKVIKLKQFKESSYLIDKRWSKTKALINVVGEDDRKKYVELGAGNNCFFSHHPHYSYTPATTTLTQVNGKLTVLVSGENHSVYIGNFLDRIVAKLSQNADLANTYKFTFVGKDFEAQAEQLKTAGFETAIATWVDSYEDTIAQANIQLFPIVVGTGTKGKVLCALATGLLCIGTYYAFENIRIDFENDCLMIKTENDVITALRNVAANKSHFENMAKTAAEKVRELHAPEVTAAEFWDRLTAY